MIARKLSVIVPVYFNEGSLELLFTRLLQVEARLAQMGGALELIFVDDGSRDRSYEILLGLKLLRPETIVVRLTRNFGALASSPAGFPFATGDCIAVLAADLQDPPEQLLPMFESWLSGNLLIFSYRRSREDPMPGRLFSAIHHKLVRAIISSHYPKEGADLLLMDRTLLPHVLSLKKGINYSVYLTWLGFKPTLIPYDRLRRTHGRSRWTLRKKLAYFTDTLTGFTVTPFRIVAACAPVVILLGGLGIALWGPRAQAPLVCWLTLVFVALFAMLFLAGEYLWRILEVVAAHPKSLIAESSPPQKIGSTAVQRPPKVDDPLSGSSRSQGLTQCLRS